MLGTDVSTLQAVSHRLHSVNGSDINMGCASPLVRYKGGMMVCDDSETYLFDGCSPTTIDTSTSNWASQLVTLKSKKGNDVITDPHAVLMFDFDTAVSLDSIELDLFLCPQWNIGAPGIFVYVYRNSTLVFNRDIGEFIGGKQVSQSRSSCDSLLTVRIPLMDQPGVISSYHSFHIVVDFNSEEIE